MKIKTNQSIKKTLLHAFIGGIGWAAGASVGLTILITLLSYLIKILGGMPYVGQLVGQIAQYAQEYLNSIKTQ